MTRDEIVEASTKVADCWGSLTYRVGANIYTVCDLIAALTAQPSEARCPTCEGSGSVDGSYAGDGDYWQKNCPTCHGTGATLTATARGDGVTDEAWEAAAPSEARVSEAMVEAACAAECWASEKFNRERRDMGRGCQCEGECEQRFWDCEGDRLAMRAALSAALAPAPAQQSESKMQDTIDIVFDGPPGPEAGRFVEVESPAGKSIRIGEWIEDAPFWRLRIPLTAELRKENEKLKRVATLEGHDKLIAAAETAEQSFAQAYYKIIGRSPVWADGWGYDQALEEIDEAQRILRSSAAPAQDWQPIEKSIRDFTLGELQSELHRRAQEFAGDPRICVTSTPLAETKGPR